MAVEPSGRGPGPPAGDGALAAAVALAARLLTTSGDVDTAHHLLVRAVEGAPPSTDPATARRALAALLLVAAVSGRDGPWRPVEAALARLGPVAAGTAALAGALADPARADGADLDRLDAAIAGADGDPVLLGAAAVFTDRLAGVRAALHRVAERAVAGPSGVAALSLLAVDALTAGERDDAADRAARAVAQAEAHGWVLLGWPGRWCLGALAALRGDADAAGAHADAMAAWAAPRGARAVELLAAHLRMLVAAARGDAEETYRQASTISPAGELPPHVPMALWAAFDLVEAAVRTGRQEAGAAHAAALGRLELARRSPRLALVTAATAGLVDPAGGAADLRRALAVPGADRFPLDRARVQLALGERLRRDRAAGAGSELAAARDAFRRLGALPWAARAARELRATEGGRAGAVPRPRDELTAQEREIAQLAATGLSNKEIAALLQLSPRTVGAHLYRVFPKLGVTARAALRDALTARDGAGAHPAYRAPAPRSPAAGVPLRQQHPAERREVDQPDQPSVVDDG